MKYIAAYILALLGGNENPKKEDIERIIKCVGIEIDQTKIEELIEKMRGNNINKIIDEGKTKLSYATDQQNKIQNESQERTTKINEENTAEEEETEELGTAFDILFDVI